tara:strand:- start:29 stop:238 length:210 start_codon:yes stop_codon:yes gene_type:complete
MKLEDALYEVSDLLMRDIIEQFPDKTPRPNINERSSMDYLVGVVHGQQQVVEYIKSKKEEIDNNKLGVN